MKVSVVILNWNGRKMMERFLPSVCRYSALDGVEVVVADNASTDDSLAFLSENYPQIRQIVLDKNYGFADGYNRTLAQIDAEYFVLLNSDVEVTDGWLDPMIEYLDAHPDIAACQPKIHAFYDKNRFEHAGAAGGFIDKWGYVFCRGRILSVVEEDKGQYDSVTDLFWATGASLFVRATAFKENGGLDGGFFAHMEEIDFCWRLRCRGYRVVCIPQSVVYHVGGGTLNVDNPHKTYLNYRNNLLMIYKNELEKRLAAVMVMRYFLDYLSAFVFLFKGDVANFKAIYRARKDFKKILPTYKEARKNNLANMKVSDIKEIYNGSIVYDFFVKGTRAFRDWR
ncbi:MAG: glycosyltransferase family 2 protein [Paludibacteraceae bacterium]|nr:glycosyltransferase family 2 protein [Paludibacteraceae bacterium]